ncbi:MAG: hypothetical protein ACRDVE_17245, partial [Actinocrinis sp.]
MISLDVADLVVIAGRTLGVDTDVALGQLDVAAAQAALAEARSGGRWQRGGPGDRSSAAEAGIGVVQALLRHRPFPRHGERVAVAAGLQFLALNGWRADLDPPATAAVVVEALASGRLSADNAAAWLSPRLSPRRTTETAAVRVPRRGPQPGSAPARGHARGGRTLVSAALAAVLGSLALLATACSQGPVMSGAPPVDRHSTVQQSRIPSQGSVEAAR